MTIEEIAKKAGVRIVRCTPEWGGTFGYKSKDYPNSTVCGFKTRRSAYAVWAKDQFGKHGYAVLIALIVKNKELKVKLTEIGK